MTKSLNRAFDAQGNDITGQPVLHEKTGRPMFDADGPSSEHIRAVSHHGRADIPKPWRPKFERVGHVARHLASWVRH